MITLRDTIEIKASPEQIFEWFAHFEENFHAWHPDHVECRFLKGKGEEGSILYVEEYLHGKLHKLKMHITKVEPNSRMEYRVSGGRGTFIIEPRDSSVLFTAELCFGTKIPLLGGLVDRLMRIFLSRQLEGIKRHMVEEGQNLKKIMEEGGGSHYERQDKQKELTPKID